jgi:hypothetical protein
VVVHGELLSSVDGRHDRCHAAIDIKLRANPQKSENHRSDNDLALPRTGLIGVALPGKPAHLAACAKGGSAAAAAPGAAGAIGVDLNISVD